MAFLMIASGFSAAQEAQAAAKLSMPKKVTVKAGKSKKIKITAKGYTVQKVTCVSEAQNVKIKTTKKAVTITAKKGTGGQSDFLVTTVTAKKGGKTSDYTFYTNVTIKGSKKKTTKKISTLAELKSLDPTSSTTTYVLANDIDMSGWKEPLMWVYCSFDGAGHTLKNLKVPFIGKLYGGTVENMTFDLAMTSSYNQDGDSYLAPICYLGPGNENEVATVKNCKSTGFMKPAKAHEDQSGGMEPMYVGGLVGNNPNNYGLITNCLNAADITITGDAMVAVGGIIGNIEGQTGVATIVECKNSGNIDVDNSGLSGMGCGVGGIAGYAMSSAVTRDCLNTGKVHAAKSERSGGGITGFGDQRLENCVNLGETSFGVVGGTVDADIIKSWDSSTQMFKNVYYAATIENGFNWNGNPVEVKGVASVSTVTDKSAFAGLDFSKTWTMTDNGPDLKNIPN